MNRRHVMGVLCAGAAALALGGRFGLAAEPGPWRQVKPIPQVANEVVGAAVNGQFLVYGGLSDFVAQGYFFMYDPLTDQWTSLPKPPEPVHHAAAVGIGSRFYVFGGFRKPDDGTRYWMPVNSTWAFDLSSRRWERLAPMPTARGALTAAAAGNTVYVIGGAAVPVWAKEKGLTFQFGGEQSSANEVYDAGEDKWTRANPMLTGRNHMNCGLIDGKIYVVGGRVGSAFVGASTNIAANEAYDVAKDAWEPKALMPTPRSGHGVAVLRGRLHAIGGEGVQGSFLGVFRAHEVYDPTANTWALYPPMLTARHGYAIATIGDSIYTATVMNTPGTGGGPATGVQVTEVFG